MGGTEVGMNLACLGNKALNSLESNLFGLENVWWKDGKNQISIELIKY